jgi:hypothetical protein
MIDNSTQNPCLILALCHMGLKLAFVCVLLARRRGTGATWSYSEPESERDRMAPIRVARTRPESERDRMVPI